MSESLEQMHLQVLQNASICMTLPSGEEAIAWVMTPAQALQLIDVLRNLVGVSVAMLAMSACATVDYAGHA